MNASRHGRGFTLIELLIVVAIIAILAAIAVPNFLEAQVRAKVSRIKNDMRSCATAMESYIIDHNRYPLISGEPSMTTPVSYISSWPRSPFLEGPGPGVTSPFRWEHLQANRHMFIMTTEGDQPINDIFDSRWNPPAFGACQNCETRDYVMYATFLNSATTLFPAAGQLAQYRDASKWSFKSYGPDGYDNVTAVSSGTPAGAGIVLYDPTNGTTSGGDILMFGPGIGFAGQR